MGKKLPTFPSTGEFAGFLNYQQSIDIGYLCFEAQDVGQFNVSSRRSGPGPLGNLSGRAQFLETSALKPCFTDRIYAPHTIHVTNGIFTYMNTIKINHSCR